jgi:phage/plasmid-associated DNA primase
MFPDAAIRKWFMQLMAVGVTGVSDKMFVFLHGGANRGKTQVVSLICDLLGTYARADLNSSMISKDAKPWDRAALRGLRLGLIDEMPSGAGGPTETLKKITGGAPINAEYKNKPQFEFKPTHTLVFASNSVPDLKDEAVVQRIRSIECSGNIARIRATRAKLGDPAHPASAWVHEAPGVLYALVGLARAYLRKPELIAAAAAPATVKRAQIGLVHEQNVLASWLDESVEWLKLGTNKKEWLQATQIYDEFLRWCKANPRGRRYLNEAYTVDQFGKELSILAKRRGLSSAKYGGRRLWPIQILSNRVKFGGISR